jgi:membrane protein
MRAAMHKKVSEAIAFFRGDLHRLEVEAKHRGVRLAIRQLRIFLYVAKRLVQGRHTERAAALTYLTMLALIPLLAVIFSLVKAFGGFADLEDEVRDFLLDYIPDSSAQVAKWLQAFIDNFNAGAVGLVGMAALLVTLIMTLSAVENALDETWAVRNTRGWGMRLIVYWSLITVAPLFLGVSLAITAAAQSTHAAHWLDQHVPAIGLLQGLVPMFATALAFTTMYAFLPSARVGIGAAWVGGLFAGVMFELAKWAYTAYTAQSVSSNKLYGSLAAFPVFVIWVNYSWRIVLCGADVVHATQYYSSDPTEETDPRTNQATREEAAVRIVALVTQAFVRQERPPSVAELCKSLWLPAHLTDVLCYHLVQGGLLREVVGGRRGLAPARPVDALTVADVIRLLRHKIGVAHWVTESDRGDQIDKLLLGCEAKSMEQLAAIRWVDLVDDASPSRPTPPSTAGTTGAERNVS